MKAILVTGARPNFMKVKPVLAALEERAVRTVLVHTGQHYGAMSDVFFDELGLRAPDHHLNAHSGTHAEQTARVMVGFEELLEKEDGVDVVVVAGDVNSTLACALVTAKAGLLLAHLEAGLRSRDWSMPEEVNRVVTDRVSDYLLAPSQDAVSNLEVEGYRADQIHLVGNVMVDTVLANLERARSRTILGDLGLMPGRYGLVTLHRPSNVDHPEVLSCLLAALGVVARECPLVFPVHPRTRERLRVLPLPSGLQLVEPLGYLDFVALESQAAVVFTDSGGVQEETTALGIPCLTLRRTTERPITVAEGTNTVVGLHPEAIVSAARRVLREPPVPRRPALWDGCAGERSAEVLLSAQTSSGRLRPTDLLPPEATSLPPTAARPVGAGISFAGPA